MDGFLSIVRRPQFASITSVVLPDRVDLGDDGLRQLALACPMIQEIDLGQENTTIRATDDQIMQLPGLFQHLSKVGFNMIIVTEQGICRFLKRMGPRLLEIRIRSIVMRGNHLTNAAFISASQHCPNLTGFGYMMAPSLFQTPTTAFRGNHAVVGPTSRGILSLLSGCPKLESLVLVGASKRAARALRRVAETNDIGNNLEYLEWRSFSKHHLDASVEEDHLRSRLEKKIATCQWNRRIAPYLKLHPWKCECGRISGCLCF